MTRRTSLLLILTVTVLLTVAYAVRRARNLTLTPAVGVSADLTALTEAGGMPHLLFRHTGQDSMHGRLMLVRLDDRTGIRYDTGLTCDRVHRSAGVGVCLVTKMGVSNDFHAVVFDRRFDPVRSIKLNGVPSRVKVSPNGHFAGITVFQSGHSYAAPGEFSTETTVIETATGKTIADLESFSIIKDGRPFSSSDFNFWGITFTSDSNIFYATLASQRIVYLIRGSVTDRMATVINEGVECPSISPDGRYLAFKQRTSRSGPVLWRLALLDLETGARHVLASETRNVDDQVEWLDNTHVIYSMPDATAPARMNVFAIPIDGGSPVEYVSAAYSAAAH
jgi:hypothetical protein